MKCDACKFWSDMLAKDVDGIVYAKCENKNSGRYMEYTGAGGRGCEQGEEA